MNTQLLLPLSSDPLAAIRARWSMPSNVQYKHGVAFTTYAEAQADVLYLLDRIEQLQATVEPA